MRATFAFFVLFIIKTIFAMEDACSQGSSSLSIGNLKKLDLKQIGAIRLEAIETFCSDQKTIQTLGVLDLSGNCVREVPRSIGYLSNLQDLNLSCNKCLLCLPQEIAHLALKKLNISKAGLSPETIAELCSYPLIQQNLEVFELESMGYLQCFDEFTFYYKNALVNLPRTIGSFRSLQELNLKGNKELLVLPPEIAYLRLKKLNVLQTGLSLEAISTLCSYPLIQGNLEVLKFESDKTHGFIPQVVKGLRNLKKLKLSGNGLTAKTVGALCSYRNIQQGLEVLELGGYKSKFLPREIGQLRKLKKLKLDYSELSLQAIGALCSYWNIQQSLEVLDLRDAYGERGMLSPEVGSLRNLRVLILKSGNSKELPFEIGNLSFLEVLDLDADVIGCNALEGLPLGIKGLNNLKILRLRNNKLTPEAIATLCSYPNIQEKLEELYLSGNNLEQLPPEIGQLRKLKKLMLNGNRLCSLPAEIGWLSNLEVLDLSKNQFVALLPEIGCLSHLKRLKLSDNLLCNLPPQIGCLNNLEILDLNHNKLVVLPLEIEYLRDNLRILNLGWNNLNDGIRKRIESTMPMSWFDAYTYIDRNGHKITRICY